MSMPVVQTVVSYAQFTEDVILGRFLSDIQQGFYVDIGAAWPSCHSVTKFFYERGWHGINVEPVEEHFQALCLERARDINIHAAVSSECGIHTFYTHGGISTLSSEIALACTEKHNVEYQQIEVQTYTLTQIFDTYVRDRDVHFLKIDAEGHEKIILESLDFLRYKPWILCVEALRPDGEEVSHEFEAYILQQGYSLVHALDGSNYYILNHKREERIYRFNTNPQWNVIKAY